MQKRVFFFYQNKFTPQSLSLRGFECSLECVAFKIWLITLQQSQHQFGYGYSSVFANSCKKFVTGTPYVAAAVALKSYVSIYFALLNGS